MVDDDEIAVVVSLPAIDATTQMVLMLHGGPGGQKDGPDNLYVDLAERLAAVDIASVRFDFRGCGESTGRYRDMTMQRQVDEMRAVRTFVDQQYRPARWAMIGDSYGATIGLLGLDPAYRCMVLLWPAIWLLDGAFASCLLPQNVAAAQQHGSVELDGEQIGLGFLRELQQIGEVSSPLAGLTTPTLFVHGTADREVPVRQSTRAGGLVAGEKKVVAVDDGDHCLSRPHEREIVYRETVNWIRRHG
ncbi:alpha/beta hydrolase family protein [Micromonospora sp. NBC_01813]|uniref:alpha/beta hydrolase family protein n=1 Tax=Micromonospora sp. NBC_01813 TaxID=2975988 RepID=UPI002DD99638|nr:alpha/beta fold hydrolase [Micromonospora sp. NBC_01813]WSA08542.1 alpha/beta hydrolase [Micromonospora sp. NBC_01813]